MGKEKILPTPTHFKDQESSVLDQLISYSNYFNNQGLPILPQSVDLGEMEKKKKNQTGRHSDGTCK